MSQYYEVLNQGEKPSDTQFYTNVEDQTVQYVITPDKTQVQFPTQQIVVTSGEQLMVVDGQPQQIIIDQSSVAYQTQQIQQVQQVQAPQAVMQQQMPQHTQLQQAQVVQQGQLQGQMQQPQTQMPQEIQTQRQQQAQMQHVQIQQHSSMQQQQSQQQNLSPQNQAPTQQQGGVQQQQSPAPQQQTQVLQPQQQQVQLQQQQVQVQGLQGHQFAVIHDNRMGGGTQQIFLMGTTSNASMVEQANQQQQQPIVLNHQLGQGNAIVRPASRIGAMVQGVRAAMRQPLIQQSPRPQQSRPQQMRSPGSVQGMQSPRVGQAVRQVTPGQQAKQVRPVMQRPQQFRAVLGGVPRGSPVGQIVGQTVGGQQRFRAGMIQQRSPTQMQRPGPPNQRFQTMQQVQQQSQQQLQMQQQAQVQQQGQIQQQDQIQQQQVQQQQNSSPDVEEMETNSNEEQEAVTLPDGNVVTVSTYKKMLAEQKARALNQNRQPLLGQPQQQQQLMSSLQTNGSPASLTPNAAKKRPPAPRTPRTSARGGPRTPAKRMQAQMHAQYMMGQPQQQQQQMQNHQQQQQIIANQQMRPSQANYIIQPPKPNQKPQQQRPLPAYIPSSQIQKIIESTAMTEEFSDSIRMLVLLENGEQRLITFTLPKEACTILEILEQVNVPFQAETNIQVTEANSNGINYIVTVGNVLPLRYQEEEESEQPPQGQPDQSAGTQDASSSSAVEPLQPPPAPPSSLQQMPPPHAPAPLQQPAAVSEQPSTPPKTPSPEPAKEVPKFVPGMLALCGACGYLSEDFNKCIRCNRKLPDNVKAIPATLRPSGSAGLGHKKEQPVPQLSQPPPPTPVNPVLQQNKPHITIKTISGVKKKANKKSVEQESVVISSDEEEEDKPNVADNIIQKLGASVTICPVTKEPSSNEIIRHNSLRRTSSEELDENDFGISMKFRTIRIGSYRCIPAEKVSINAIRILLKVPHPSNDKDIKTLVFERENVVKVLASFNSSLPVLFLYVNPILAQKIRTELDMTADGDYYFDPISSQDESFRRVTFLPDDITEDEQKVIQTIFGPPNNILDELNIKEANDILIKTCPKDVTRTALGIGAFTEIKQLLTYPPEGRGRMSISTEDYLCLAQDQFLNDVIIDFYLKYLVENLPEEKRCKVHVFSTFFYNRLTTKPAKASRKSQPTELDPTLSPAQKRHARVKTWTKKVNLFEKDFIIVPINENAHWFLAIICFPGMDGCQTWDGKPIKIEVKKRTKKNPAAAGTSTPTATVKQDKTASAEKAILCDDGASSDKDEAEGDESDLESDESRAPSPTGSTSSGGVTGTAAPSPATVVTTPTTNTSTKKEPRPPIKQPCILIFDSLAGASRNRVVATLRDYLTCEYKAKMGTDRIYNRDIIKGANPKVPQQNNFTDCGLYVLQYVEQFFKDPIKDYHMPIKQIQNWFEEITVTKKREDIAILIRTLMREYGKDVRILPDITFPTLNGKLVERSFEDEEDEEMEEEATAEEEEEADEDSLTSKDESSIKQDPAKEESERGSSAVDMGDQESSSPIKPSSLAPSSDFAVQPVLNPKPDISEFPRQTNKDTLSILKAKRIVKNKNPGPSLKKQKIDE